ncbi:T9SS type A sorting domain-containing protein [candidate division WOR-3 bacterium]|uniref:T9SS type A sorting domain-containing protein n=1 Tax=candidate division WOR-3 bacterium TaxID=2052148 RepID=A0A9D5K7A9_UNCW3|nr:T9SS type A sorting domain-containing protein [candidate division WOR-3 bacterium]MBD3363663.1 T9SS type A sorting domain-containing protein [candidate division WOR-3 bacterium]
MNKKLIALALVVAFTGVAFAGGTVGWVKLPTDETGWYWGFDDPSDKPFDHIEDLDGSGFGDIHDDPDASMLAAYNDRPYKYEIQDSFWYYGNWYKDGNHLYLSPDGWVSFDENGVDGKAYPPDASPPIPHTDDPNELIAALWQDNDPTIDEEGPDNRLYYLWKPLEQQLHVQWYNVKGYATENEFDYSVVLQFGGQLRLATDECGVLNSRHYITCTYRDADDWDSENGVSGIEGYSGEYGVLYSTPDDFKIVNNQVVKYGYSFIRQHDVIPVAFTAPGEMVLRYTPLEPWVWVQNIGKESETFNIILDIYDLGVDPEERVYHQVVAGYHLDSGELDDANFPCWTPEELFEEGTHYYRKELIVSLDGDQCKHNDTLAELSYVHCDDSLGYEWDLDALYTGYWSPNYGFWYVFGTSYRMDGGVLVNGGRIFMAMTDMMKNTYGLTDMPRLDIWEANNGCGQPAQDGNVGYGITETYQDGWNFAGIEGDVGPRETDLPENAGELVEDLGMFVNADPDEGNIWASATSSGIGGSAAGTGGWVSALNLLVPPNPSNCYFGPPDHRGAIWQVNTNHNWQSWYGYMSETFIVELIVHLGFNVDNPRPQAPCYYDYPHDLTIYRVNKPDQDFVEHDIEITAELALGNLGRQAEPDEEHFPVEMFVVDWNADKDTSYSCTVQIQEIGWFGEDDPPADTMFVPMLPWIPEGICLDWQTQQGYAIPDEDEAANRALIGRHYELVGLVRLGEVGPDLSDHCPYNDTCRKFLTALLAHDVGVVDLQNEEGNPWGNTQADPYPEGTEFTCIATVENFGFHEEHDVPVDLEIYDVDIDSLVWHNIQEIEHLDWRGNDLGDPYWIDVTFPTWTTPSEHWFRLECRTELVGDQCPENDEVTEHINSGIAEDNPPTPFALEAIVPNPFVGSTKVSFAVPHTTKVSLKVYDISGKLVATLVDGNQNPGRHSVAWNGDDNAGRTVAQGIYLVRMEAESFSATKKVVLY